MATATPDQSTTWDPDKFRLRRFVDRLVEMGEVDFHNEPIALAALSPIISGTDRALLFRQAGPERLELVTGIMSSRKRLAAAFGVPEESLRAEFTRRMARPQRTFEIRSDEAPVHQEVLTGDKIDLTKLPFFVEHEYDGAPYMSSGIDYVIDPATKRSNVGCRRLMLRGKNKLGFNLTAPSDLREIYRGCTARGEKLPMSFTVAAYPLDTMAAVSRNTGDEINALATLRGEPLAVVKCLTNDVRVPADAEIVLEGYVDERGYSENEGPYGEYMGYYGPMHLDPVFHVTAITRRRDVLYQTYKHGIGKKLGECDGASTVCLQSEVRALALLRRAKLDPVDVYVSRAAGLGCNMRVSLRKRTEEDARTAIKTILTEMLPVKHVFVTDEDIDLRSTDEFEWALATRFQADRDLVVMSNMRLVPMDLSAAVPGIGSKAGFDLTFPYPRSNSVTARVAGPAHIGGPARFQTVHDALGAGPTHFAKLMSAVGSDDGREVVLEIERLGEKGLIDRNSDGEYFLKNG